MAAFPRFEELPPEVQAYILEQQPGTLRRAPELSRRIQQLVEPNIVREFCSRPISDRELGLYLDTNPLSFGISTKRQFGPYNIDSNFTLYYGLTRYLYIVLDSTVETTASPTNRYVRYFMEWSGNEDPAKDMFQEAPEIRTDAPGFAFDLNTQHEILSNRAICIRNVKEGLDYVKDIVLEQLDNVYSTYTNGDPYHGFNLFYTYVYLSNQAILIRTRTLPTEGALEMRQDENGILIINSPEEQEQVEEMIRLIPIMYTQIRDYLVNL